MMALALLFLHLLLLDASSSAAAAQPPPTPPPFAGPGIGLAPIFTDHAVLQRAPAVSALFGVVVGDSHATGAMVAVTSDADGTSYSVAAAHIERVNATYFRWKAALRPTAAGGGSHTITATCVGCLASSTGSAAVRDVVFGDVYVCSGQSNMWLPMHFSLSRNLTYDAMLAGKLKHIRMNTIDMNMQTDGNPDFDPFIGVPASPYSGVDFDYPGGGWLLPSVGDYPHGGIRKGMGNYQWNNNTVDTFSAACFHFAEGLAEIAEQKNESAVPLGLISSSWGGTVVEVWTPNATLQVRLLLVTLLLTLLVTCS